MHFALLTVPSSGQFNVQLATARELVAAGHAVTFLSGDSFLKHLDRFKDDLDDVALAKNIHFVSLGQRHTSTRDFTPTVRAMLPRMRRKPGDIRSLQACTEIGFPSWDDHCATAKQVAEHVNLLHPDMVVVDVLSPAMVNGVRMTGRPYYLTIPCSPGLTVDPDASVLTSPHPAAGHRNAGSMQSVVESAYLAARDRTYYYLQRRSTLYRRKARRLQNELGLAALGNRHQEGGLVPPYWRDANCLGGVHFNVAGLLDCPQQPAKLCFVGAGIPTPPVVALTPHKCDTDRWLDEAHAQGATVVFVNMGSMFVWSETEFAEMLSALAYVYERLNGSVRFLFKAPKQSSGLAIGHAPHYVRLSTWIEDQQRVYQHPAVRVFVHHGGGNSFNEAVFYGMPQIIIGQWLDHHEYASLVKRFGLGVGCRGAPHIKARYVQDALMNVLGDPSAWLAMKRASMHWAARSRIGGGPHAAAQLLIRGTEQVAASHSPLPSPSLEEKPTDSCATSITCIS